MAHKLGIQVIAEGVETSAQGQLLREIGCDFGQGFLYSKALPVGEFESLLADIPW
jgi:EAL domain-containing protein (putative c-di-GMP-specific phosphodiesterase class I)